MKFPAMRLPRINPSLVQTAYVQRNEEAQQAASRNADSASSLVEFSPSVGVFLFCIVVYG